jgi:hypothetical protein
LRTKGKKWIPNKANVKLPHVWSRQIQSWQFIKGNWEIMCMCVCAMVKSYGINSFWSSLLSWESL